MTNGPYSITGGFWALPQAVQTEGPPVPPSSRLERGRRGFVDAGNPGLCVAGDDEPVSDELGQFIQWSGESNSRASHVAGQVLPAVQTVMLVARLRAPPPRRPARREAEGGGAGGHSGGHSRAKKLRRGFSGGALLAPRKGAINWPSVKPLLPVLLLAWACVDALAATVAPERHILTVHRGAELDDVAREHRLRLVHRYERYTKEQARSLTGQQHALRQRLQASARTVGFEAAGLTPARLDALRNDPRVKRVEPDGRARVHLQEQSVSRVVGKMGLTNFAVTPVNQSNAVTIDVGVAVLDSGIADLADLNVVQRVGFADAGLNGWDWHGHGSRMAAIIGAKDNDIGIVGVAPGAKLWSVQVIGPTEYYWVNVFAGLDFIAQHTDEISVVNASFASYDPAPRATIQEKIQALVNAGVVFVAAVGNHSQDLGGLDEIMDTDDDTLPASLAEVMAVSGYDDVRQSEGGIWGRSGRSTIPHPVSYVNSPGGAIDLTAYAIDVLTITTNGETYMTEGTSASTALVSGLVALYSATRGRAHDAAGVYAIRQAIVDAALPQTQWPTYPLTYDFDGYPEPLARISTNWITAPRLHQLHAGAFRFHGTPRFRYTAQFTDTLTASNAWTDFAMTNGTGHTITLTNAAPATNRFYRVKMEPAP